MRREVLYNILIEFWVPMKWLRLTKMCLNETHSKGLIGCILVTRLVEAEGEAEAEAELEHIVEAGQIRSNFYSERQ
jgi:hypothetical protein